MIYQKRKFNGLYNDDVTYQKRKINGLYNDGISKKGKFNG